MGKRAGGRSVGLLDANLGKKLRFLGSPNIGNELKKFLKWVGGERGERVERDGKKVGVVGENTHFYEFPNKGKMGG